MRRLRRTFVAGLVALALSGCTLITPNASPHTIATKNVPFGLLGKTIPGTNHARVRFITQPVYLVDATGHLTPSSRIVPLPATLTSVIQQLLLGPSHIEKSLGYTSALPPKLILVSAKLTRAVGYLNFDTALSTLPAKAQLLAAGQLVLTAQVVGATKGIVIEVAGVTQRILLPDGKKATLATGKNFQVLLNA